MSKKTKNCKKKCCCCCCKPKPPTPNLCDELVSTYTIAPLVTQTISPKLQPTTLRYCFFQTTTDNDIMSERFFYDANGKLNSIYTFSAGINYNFVLYYYYVVSCCAADLPITTSFTLMNFLNSRTNTATCLNPFGSCTNNFELSNSKINESVIITPTTIVNNIQFKLGGDTGTNSIRYVFDNTSNFSIIYLKVPFTLSTKNIINAIVDVNNVNNQQIIPLFDTYRTLSINATYLNRTKNNGFYYIDNNSFVSLGSVNVSYVINGEFTINVLSGMVKDVNYTFTLYYRGSDGISVSLGSEVYTISTNNVSIKINNAKINFVNNNNIILFLSVSTDKSAPQIQISTNNTFDFIVNNTAICNV